jgi:hypothetical protein
MYSARDRVTETTKYASRAAGARPQFCRPGHDGKRQPCLAWRPRDSCWRGARRDHPRSAVEEELLGEIGDRAVSAARGRPTSRLSGGNTLAGWEATKEGSSEGPHDGHANAQSAPL